VRSGDGSRVVGDDRERPAIDIQPEDGRNAAAPQVRLGVIEHPAMVFGAVCRMRVLESRSAATLGGPLKIRAFSAALSLRADAGLAFVVAPVPAAGWRTGAALNGLALDVS
jgi:hypothetical protein